MCVQSSGDLTHVRQHPLSVFIVNIGDVENAAGEAEGGARSDGEGSLGERCAAQEGAGGAGSAGSATARATGHRERLENSSFPPGAKPPPTPNTYSTKDGGGGGGRWCQE